MPDNDIDIPDVLSARNLSAMSRSLWYDMHAAQIVTYSTFEAKQAIRDVFKRFGLPRVQADQYLIGFSRQI